MKTWISVGFSRPIGKLFELRGNESKHRLKRRFFQIPLVGRTHTMLLFGVRKATLNCFLTLSIQRIIYSCRSEMLRFMLKMTRNHFSLVATLSTLSEKRTYLTHKRIQDILTVNVSRRRSITKNLLFSYK